MNRIFNILLVLKEKNITVWESEGKLNFRAPKGVNIESELKLMKQHKSEIVEFLKNESDLNKINIEPEKKYESFPLTDVQTAYLLGRKDVFDYGSVACHIYMEYEYEDLEPEKATICWNKLIQRHEMLRTVFSDNEGTQKVLETVPKFEIVYRDISEMDTMYANQYLENVRDQMGQRVYDASKWPIFDIRITKTIGVSESSEIIDIKGKQNSNGISQTPQVFIDCQVADDEEGLKVNWDVRQGIFPENMVADMFRAFEEILYKLSFSFDNWEEKEIVALPKFEIDLFKKVNDTKECYDIEPLG